MRFDANLSMLFTELPLAKRPAAAAAAGFEAAELWWPFETPIPDDAQVDQLLDRFDEAGVALIALNFDAGDMAQGDRGLLSLPGERDRFRSNVDVVVEIADRTGCQVLNALYGNRQDGVHPQQHQEIALDNLAYTLPKVDRVGASLVLEAINVHENPLYPLNRTADTLAFIELASQETGYRPKLLYDCYHMQRMEGELTATMADVLFQLAHVQVADVPGRNEPGTGEVAFSRVLAALELGGYDRYVGLEYRPSTSTTESLRWLDDWRTQR